jgi:hypothetical protein
MMKIKANKEMEYTYLETLRRTSLILMNNPYFVVMKNLICWNEWNASDDMPLRCRAAPPIKDNTVSDNIAKASSTGVTL